MLPLDCRGALVGGRWARPQHGRVCRGDSETWFRVPLTIAQSEKNSFAPRRQRRAASCAKRSCRPSRTTSLSAHRTGR